MGESVEFTAPLGPGTGMPASGRLVFANGAAGVTIEAGPALDGRAGGEQAVSLLAAGHFVHPALQVRASGGTVTVEYPPFPVLERLVSLRRPSGRIQLNALLPWEIEFRRGASRIRADLRRIQLRSLDVLGGASQVALVLSKSPGTTYIYIAGGASQVRILRPPGVGVCIHVCGGATSLSLDEQRFRALGNDTGLESSEFRNTAYRYDIRISGGASRVSIGRE